MVCMVSSTGRWIASHTFDWAAAMPSGMPIAMQITTDTVVPARVYMVIGQRSAAPTKNSATAVTMANPHPTERQTMSPTRPAT